MGSVNELCAFHPCDRCGARSVEAWHNAKTGALLTFCAHHAREHEVAMAQRGFALIMVAQPEPA